ncbi:hypothetical protein Glove_233g43 [Diversispora epigaea]|uniref:CCHC-type domain-containing protein n=1 Tax=Diversispora epigaea TaxID=1348612 RepID=A0A397IH00_9GLOM|nr:hypothetical protein Glove_233g43 [Diversispora epigaea]
MPETNGNVNNRWINNIFTTPSKDEDEDEDDEDIPAICSKKNNNNNNSINDPIDSGLTDTSDNKLNSSNVKFSGPQRNSLRANAISNFSTNNTNKNAVCGSRSNSSSWSISNINTNIKTTNNHRFVGFLPSRCFACGRIGHYVNTCPNKRFYITTRVAGCK